MQKRLSEIVSLSSQVRVGTPVKQLVRDKLVWVAFLEHSGFFKWFADGATPGYLTVSAHDPADVQLVTELNGQPLKLRYLLSAYFGDQVERHAYLAGHATVGLTDFEPEIDDHGVPYFVGTTYAHKVGFSGSESTGIVTVNAVTGEVLRYALGAEPTGTIVRIAAEFRNNQTMYYITLASGGTTLGTIFTGSSDLSEELVLTKPGDKVELSYSDSHTRVVGMSKFHNLDIPGL